MEESHAASDDPRCRDQLRGARRARRVGGPPARRATRAGGGQAARTEARRGRPSRARLRPPQMRRLPHFVRWREVGTRGVGPPGFFLDGGSSENEGWAEDLHELLLQLDAAPAFIGGSSSGCRLALLA